MKASRPIHQKSREKPEENLRIHRSVSLYLEQEKKLIAASEGDPRKVSGVVRELIDRGLTDSGAKRYLDARDKGIQFAEDVERLLRDSGIQCVRDSKVNGIESHRTDIMATWKGGKVCVELKSSGRPEHLSLALGMAMILAGESRLPAVVCVPYLLPSKVTKMYETTGVGLATPESVVSVVKGLAGSTK